MRSRALPILLALAVAPAARPPPPAGGGWGGGGGGARRPMRPPRPDNLNPTRVEEIRYTLKSVTESKWWLSTEVRDAGRWIPTQEVYWDRPKTVTPGGSSEATTEGLGVESVVVDGKAHACTKSRTTAPDSVSTSWVSEEHGLLKSEWKGTKRDGSVCMVVTALSKKVKVGQREIGCRESKTVISSAGREATALRLESDAVPGRLVRLESTSEGPDVSSTILKEAVAYEIK